jgi:hypothetical protein
MGVAVKMTGPGVPTARVVVVEGPMVSASLIDAYEVAAPQAELAGMLAEIAEAVASRAHGLGIDKVIVRRADKSQRPSNQEGPRIRLLAEGAIAASVRAVVPTTVIRDGVHAGMLLGPDKAAMDIAAGALLVAAGENAKYVEAAGAALAALAL